jgi:hypothetical protein
VRTICSSAKKPKTCCSYSKYWAIQNDCGQVWQLCTKIYVATCGQGKGDISLTVHRRAILKVNSTPFTQLPHKFSYIVAILGHNHFASPNIRGPILVLIPYFPTKIMMITMFNEWCKVAPLSFKSYFATHVAKNVTVI